MLTIDTIRGDALPDTLGRPGHPLVVIPFTDAAEVARCADQLARRSGAPGDLVAIEDCERQGFIAMANQAFRRSRAPFFAYIAQDAFAGRDWMRHGLAAIGQNNGGLLAFNDGKWHGALAAFGMVRRDWALTNYGGDLFHPSYGSHYADVELTLIAMQQRRFRYSPQAMVVEVDWNKEGKAVSSQDRVQFHRRNQTAFDRKVLDPGLRRMFQ